jgi:hypothetical protein
MQQMRVFVSHSSADTSFANALVEALRNAGADVWLDDSHLGTGQLLEEITRQLTNRPVFVAVLSKAAFASEWVRRECTWAFNLYGRQQNRLLLPVVVSPLDPDDFNAMLYLEDFRRVEGPNHTPFPPEEAISQTLRLLQLTPSPSTSPSPAPLPAESVADLLIRGKALSAQGRTEEALPLFARASELAPESDEVWLNYMEALSSLGRDEEARGAFEHWLTTEPSIAETSVLRGEFLWSDQQYEEALDQFNQALSLEPTNGGALLEKLAVLLALGWQEEAEGFLADLGPDARATVQRLTHYPEELAAEGVPADMREMLQRPAGQAVLQTVLGS